jgi:hypothetical protein
MSVSLIRVCLLVCLAVCAGNAAERKLTFGEYPLNQPPPGYRSTVTGTGQPGDWRIILDEVPPLLAPLTPQALSVSKKAVLAQLAQDATDEHFPLLIYNDEAFGDFTFTTRLKTVRGVMEQMAGIAFRIQNETNFYVVRASSLGNNLRFYKVLDGQRGPLVGHDLPIPTGTWHELKIQCQGRDIRCSLDGNELISVNDKVNPFLSGKIGFWTKSDSVSYFTDASVTYTPLIPPAQALVRSVMAENSKLRGLRIYVAGKEPGSSRLVASHDASELGKPGGETERKVLARGETYYVKGKPAVTVIKPLRDRNGDVIAAVRVQLRSFPGQTEENAVIRAAPILRQLQERVQSLQDLTD